MTLLIRCALRACLSAGLTFGALKCVGVEDFTYTDPKEKLVAMSQGMILTFAGGERAVFRLSGTGSEGATLRVYLEAFEPRRERQRRPVAEAVKEVVKAALAASRIAEITGRASPTVIT